MTLHPFTHPMLDWTGIDHGFFGRAGGVSEGIYRGLNVGNGSYDSKEHVAENRRRVAARFGLPPEALCTVHQIHSPTVVTVEGPIGANRPEADAMVTDRPGLVLGILTADCAPVLLADPDAGVIGAAHAGWKGAVSGVVENTVLAMEALGANRDDIAAVIGPTINQASYEVGAEFIARFSADDQAQYFIPSPREGHHLFDLPSYVAKRAIAAGLQRVAVLGLDTRMDVENFFSYRRATLEAEPDYGRQISTIVLK
jgi:YfiH family protein